jgi:hypothetical protein
MVNKINKERRRSMNATPTRTSGQELRILDIIPFISFIKSFIKDMAKGRQLRIN